MMKSQKSLCVTYLLWLLGGWFGLHHYYLRRDRHAMVWWCTAGGFGLGVFRDLWRIPEYVDDANSQPEYLKEMGQRMKREDTPPFSMLRFGGELVCGWLLGMVLRLAIPEETVKELVSPLLWPLVLPVVVAAGVYLVGNIGREQVSFKLALLSSYVSLPLQIFSAESAVIHQSALLCATTVNWKGRSWRRIHRPRRHWLLRLVVLLSCASLYSSMWASVFVHNAYVTTRDGQTILMKEAVRNFFNSPAWADTKSSLHQLYQTMREHGFSAFWTKMVLDLDPEGELHASQVLNVSTSATEKEIRSAYRALALQWHPDKVKDKQPNTKFMEIQKAYETLSSIKARRIQRQNDRQKRPRSSGHQTKDEF